jgi:methylmalonyl-CoA mutase cobalamin-binding subunit
MQKIIAASVGAAALVAALSSIAVANPTTPGVSPVVAGRHDRQVTVTRVVAPQDPARDESGIDRTFHPDYTQALTAEQMNAAWSAEVDRVMQKPVGEGGG